MKYILLFLCFWGAQSLVFSQEKLELVYSFPIGNDSEWHADLLGNLYIANKDVLVKFDTANVRQYSQSIKSMGRVRQISSINTMKIVLFSVQQQSITLVDNTLSEANEIYDLVELGFGSVSLMAISSQPNKFWIYDQAASRLVLLDLSNTQQQQEIENVRGILNSNEILWMKEDKNILYLLNDEHTLFSFDTYGTLMDVIQFPADTKSVDVFQEQIFVLKKDGLFAYQVEDKNFQKVPVEAEGVREIQWGNRYFFVRAGGVILKYQIVMNPK